MTEVEKFLERIDKEIGDYTKIYYKLQSELPRKIEMYEALLKSRESSKELKIISIFGKSSEQGHLARLAGEIALLHNFAILAIHLRSLEISIVNIQEQLLQSGMLEKVKELGDVTKLKKELHKAIKLLDEYYKEKKRMEQQIEDSRSEDLWYVQ